MATLLDTPPSPLAHSARAPSEAKQSLPVAIAMKIVTGFLVLSPAVGLAVALPLMWGNIVHLRDVVIGGVLFVITGFGISIGYHRLFTHRSFVPKRWLKIVLAIDRLVRDGGLTQRLGRGASPPPRLQRRTRRPALTARVRHRRRRASSAASRTRTSAGCSPRTSRRPSSTRPISSSDSDTAFISRCFPLFAILSLAGPFFLGWGVTGTIGGALSMLLWAGLVRMMLLHHVTWSVNSICHMFGKQPAGEKDHSTNFAPLAILSFGESWHNFHHAHPACARHGALPAPDRPVGRGHPALRAGRLGHEGALADRRAALGLHQT